MEEIKYKSKLREVISKVLSSDIEVSDVSATQNSKGYTGYIEFSVKLSSMGIEPSDFVYFRKEIFSMLFINFFTELIIRENSELFLQAISRVHLDDFDSVIGSHRHESAGLCLKSDAAVFTFHMSYLQQLFVSDFKKRIEL
jgi:hypothetical protein